MTARRFIEPSRVGRMLSREGEREMADNVQHKIARNRPPGADHQRETAMLSEAEISSLLNNGDCRLRVEARRRRLKSKPAVVEIDREVGRRDGEDAPDSGFGGIDEEAGRQRRPHVVKCSGIQTHVLVKRSSARQAQTSGPRSESYQADSNGRASMPTLKGVTEGKFGRPHATRRAARSSGRRRRAGGEARRTSDGPNGSGVRRSRSIACARAHDRLMRGNEVRNQNWR